MENKLKEILEKADKLVENDLSISSSLNEQDDLRLIRKTLLYIFRAIEEK